MTRGTPPLNDSDYASVRRSVLETIAARERRRTWTLRSMQLGFAALAIAVGSIWLLRTSSTTEPAAGIQIARNNPATPQPRNPVTQQPRNPVTQQPGNLTATLLSSPRHAAHVARRHSHHDAAVTLVATAAPLRIELATNDPDIRIIWITNPNPKESR